VALAEDIEEFHRGITRAIEVLEELKWLSEKLTECTIDDLYTHIVQLQDLCEQASLELNWACDHLTEINSKWGSKPLKADSNNRFKRISNIPKNSTGVVDLVNALEQVKRSDEQVNYLKSPRLIEGDSRKLTKNLIAKGIPQPLNYQAHHIIPSSVADKSELMLNAIEKAGFDIDCADNGIFLPPDVLGDDLLPAHRGNHPRYSNFAKAILEQKLDELKKSNLQNDGTALISAIGDTISYLRQVIVTQGEQLRPTVNDL
jgi:hypothetical protein